MLGEWLGIFSYVMRRPHVSTLVSISHEAVTQSLRLHQIAT